LVLSNKKAEVEYDIKLAIIRLSVLLGIIFIVNVSFFDSNNSISLNFEKIINENLTIIEENSAGDFFSLDENTKIIGNLNILNWQSSKRLSINEFSISNYNKNNQISIFLNKKVKQNEKFVTKFKQPGGDFEFNFGEKFEFKNFKYIVFFDEKLNKTLGYGRLK